MCICLLLDSCTTFFVCMEMIICSRTVICSKILIVVDLLKQIFKTTRVECIQTLPLPLLRGREAVSRGHSAWVLQIKVDMKRKNDSEDNIATNMEAIATTKWCIWINSVYMKLIIGSCTVICLLYTDFWSKTVIVFDLLNLTEVSASLVMKQKYKHQVWIWVFSY